MYDTKKAHYLVVTVMIHCQNKYLILKRSEQEKAFPNLWTVPGGKLETTDYMTREKDTLNHWYNVFETVGKREVKEETGIDVNNMGYLTSLVYIRSDDIPCVIVSLFAEGTTMNIMIDQKDHSEYAWVSFDELKNYELVDGLYEEFVMLQNHLTGKTIGAWSKAHDLS